MNAQPSSCELPAGAAPAAPSTPAGSRVMRYQPPFHWQGVPIAEYKQSAAHHCGVTRTTFIGAGGEATAFHVRYFEIAPGGYSSLEHHVHEHVVFVLRGRGQVQLGDSQYELGFGDVVYVAPREV